MARFIAHYYIPVASDGKVDACKLAAVSRENEGKIIGKDGSYSLLLNETKTCIRKNGCRKRKLCTFSICCLMEMRTNSRPRKPTKA